MTAIVSSNTQVASTTAAGTGEAASSHASAGASGRTAGGAAFQQLRAHGQVDRESVVTLLVTFRKQQDWDEVIGELQNDKRSGIALFKWRW